MSDLVVVSLEAWDEVWRRNQHLVSGLLALDPALRVLFVEPPADPLHDLRSGRRPRGRRGARAHASDGGGRLFTFRPVKWLPRRWDADADDRLARAIAREARRLGMRHPALWINDPRAAALSTQTRWPTLYDITDDWVVADRPAEERERLAAGEQTLLRTAAEVVACSAELVRRKSAARAGRPISLIPNAVDVAAYRRPLPRPADLPDGVIAVYVGTVHTDRFDVETCARTAQELRGVGTVVLVGPMLLDPPETARLHDAGVVTLGARPREAVVGYLQHADVLVVPHLVTEFTDSLDPIKLYEYQAAGRPVVATPVAGFRDVNDPLVMIAEPRRFPDEVTRAAQAAPQRRIAADTAPDWSERAAAMCDVIGRLAR
jgi:glycosyltransferase involved in cell wall biosynthesis